MLHPIFTTVLGHPELIANHLAGYAALVKEEVSTATHGLVNRAIAGVIAIVSALLALIFIGVAVMLGVLQGEFSWVLVIVPGVAVLLAAGSAAFAMRSFQPHSFSDLRAQVDADVRALHLVAETDHVE